MHAKNVPSSAGCRFCHLLRTPDNRPLKLCTRCQKAYYCSVEHQKMDWKKHKKTCRARNSGENKHSHDEPEKELNWKYLYHLTRYAQKKSKSNYIEALKSIKKATKYVEQNKWERKNEHNKISRGSYYFGRVQCGTLHVSLLVDMEQIPEALRELKIFQTLLEHNGDSLFGQAFSLHIEAEINMNLGLHKKAEPLLTKSLKLYELVNEKEGDSSKHIDYISLQSTYWAFNHLRKCYMVLYGQDHPNYMNIAEQATSTYEKYMHVSQSYGVNPNVFTQDYGKSVYRLGVAEYSVQKYKEAAKNYDRASELFKQSTDWRNCFNAIACASDAYKGAMIESGGHNQLCQCVRKVGGLYLEHAELVKARVIEAGQMLCEHPELLDESERCGTAITQDAIINRIEFMFKCKYEYNGACFNHPMCDGPLFDKESFKTEIIRDSELRVRLWAMIKPQKYIVHKDGYAFQLTYEMRKTDSSR